MQPNYYYSAALGMALHVVSLPTLLYYSSIYTIKQFSPAEFWTLFPIMETITKEKQKGRKNNCRLYLSIHSYGRSPRQVRFLLPNLTNIPI